MAKRGSERKGTKAAFWSKFWTYVCDGGEGNHISERLSKLYFEQKKINWGRYHIYNMIDEFYYKKLMNIVNKPTAKTTTISQLNRYFNELVKHMNHTKEFVEMVESGEWVMKSVVEDGEESLIMVDKEGNKVIHKEKYD